MTALACGGQVRQTFDTWRAALMLTERGECTVAGGTTYLRAQASRNRVQVTLTATAAAPFDGETVAR